MSSPFLPDESVAGWAAEIQNSLETFGFVMLNSRVVYEIDVTIVLPGACIVHGNGAEIRCSGPDFPAFLAKDVEWVRLNNLRITRPGFASGGGNNLTGHGDGIVVQNAKHVFMDGVQLTDHYNGIVLADCVSPIPRITNLGIPGETDYAYLVVAVADGIPFEINRPGVTRTGNATLNDKNKNRIEWGPLVSHYQTFEYRIYRTVGGPTQGLIKTIMTPGDLMYEDGDIAPAIGLVPDSPRYSPITNANPMNPPGTPTTTTTRKYAVIAVIDGVRWGNYDVVTEAAGANILGPGPQDFTVLVAWPRLYGVEGYISEVYEVYRTQGGDDGANGRSTGLIGTVTNSYHFRDTGQAATRPIPAIPRNTRNSKVTLANVQVSHSAPTAANNQYNLQINSVDYLAITNSHFDGAWLDGVKARHEVFSLTWSGGSANYNGKSANEMLPTIPPKSAGSGDGIDTFGGIYHLDLSGVEFVGNSANGTVSKTIGWAGLAAPLGNPEFGIPNCSRYRGIVASRNQGSGIQLDGVLDSTLSAPEQLRGRVRDALISDSFVENNSVYGIACNAQGVRVSNTVIRANKQHNVWFGNEASSCTLDGVQLLGASSGALPVWKHSTDYAINDRVRNGTPNREYLCITAGMSAGSAGPTTKAANITDGTVRWIYLQEAAKTYAQVLCSGTVVIKTLASDLAAGATSFTIPDATNVPVAGRVAFGRKVEGVEPARTYECWDYTRVDNTVTIAWERPSAASNPPATIFSHRSSEGDNALDVGFVTGARKIRIVNCMFNGKELSDLSQVSLDGDMASLVTVSKNNIEILDGADEIEILDNKFRFVTDDDYCSPYVAITAADVGPAGTFSGRVLLRHADGYHASPIDRYQGGIGSEYVSLVGAERGGVSAIDATKFRKESLLANTRTGWVAQRALNTATLALHSFGSIVDSGWAPDTTNQHMQSSGLGALLMPIPLKQGERITGVTFAIKGNGSANITITVYVYSSSGVSTSIGTITLNRPASSWADTALALTPTTLASGASLYIKFFSSGSGLGVGATRVHYNRP